MTDWIKASNPTASITTEAEAIGAARASALAIFLGVIWGGIGVALLMTGGGSAEIEAAVAQASADTPEMAGMGGAMVQIALWTAVGFCALQLVIGLVQWAKPNIVIPIIFAILVAFGLASGALGMMMAGQEGMPDSAAAPTWQTYVGLVILVIQLVLHIAGIRGARALDKIRMAAAQ
ncbi:MAG: hypothetical protein FD125_144 [bacterium]|nr:MAG: hypothetical protein FD125_144 [bacterium]